MIYEPIANPVLPEMIQEVFGMPDIVMFDVGCSGGIGAEWTPLLPWMRIYGFDPLLSEVERLNQSAASNVTYHDGYVIGPLEPLTDTYSSSPYRRTSTAAALDILSIDFNKEVFNSGQEVRYTERRFSLEEFAKSQGVPQVHVIKTDTDGHDMAVLRGAGDLLDGLLGCYVELVFGGYPGRTGADICALLTRHRMPLADIGLHRYSRAALPGRFVHSNLASTTRGAIMWADALHLRDVPTIDDQQQLLRLAVVAELFDLADLSAEALLRVAEGAGRARVEPMLDALVRYSAFPEAPSYKALMERFNADPKAFLRDASSTPFEFV